MIFTVICFFLNLTIFSITLLVHLIYYNAIFMENTDYVYDLSLLIAISACVILSFFGCCCYKKNRIIVVVIGVILLILFIAGFVEGFTDSIRFENLIDELVDVRFNATFELYDKNPKMKTYWDKMHKKKCCGINGPDDWKLEGNGTLPLSCCKEITLNSTQDCLKDDAYPDGCKNNFIDEINKMSCVLMTVSGIIIILHACVMVITCCAFTSVKKDDQIINFEHLQANRSILLHDISENEENSDIESAPVSTEQQTSGRLSKQISRASVLYTILDDAIQHRLRKMSDNPI